MITIHHEKETDFSKNGYGAIDDYVMSQEVTWEMNGQFYAYLEYPAFLDKSAYLVNKNILRVPVPFMEDQLFRIYRVRKVLGFIQVEARHIFYDLMDNLIEDTNIVGKTGSQAIQQLLGATQYEHRFIGFSDISTSNNARMVRYNPVEALLDDSKANTFVSRWGGEVVRDNFVIRMVRQMGTDRGVRIQHRKDLTAYIATIDESTVVTRIMPVGFDGLKLPELYIDSPLLDPDNPKIGVIRYENVKAAIGEYADDNGVVPLEEAYELLREHARAEFNTNHLDEPEMTVTVNFVTLHNTKEYADFAQLQEIHQGDVVRVSVPDEEFEITSRLVAFTSDPLQQNHYTSTTLGNHVYEFTSTTTSVSTLRNEVEVLRESVVEVRQSANGKNQSFWGEADPNTLNLNAILGDTYFRSVGEEDVIYQYVEVDGERYWKEIINTANTSEVKKEVERVAEEAEKLANDITEAQQSADDAKRDAGLALTASEALEIITQETASQLSDTRGLLATVESNASEARAKADSAVTQAGQAVSNAQTAMGDAQSALSKASDAESTVSTLSKEVDTVAGEVALKAAKSIVDTLSGTVSTHATTLTQHANSIASKASQTEVNTVKGTVATHTTTLEQQAKAISARLTQSQVDSLVTGKGYSTVSYVDNKMSVTAEGIRNEITAVEGKIPLEISNANLLDNSDFSRGLDGWHDEGINLSNLAVFPPISGEYNIQISGEVGATKYALKTYNLSKGHKGGKYIAKVRSNVQGVYGRGSNSFMGLMVVVRNPYKDYFSQEIPISAKWETSKVEFEIGEDITSIDVIGYVSDIQATVRFDQFQLNKSDLEVGWSPSAGELMLEGDFAVFKNDYQNTIQGITNQLSKTAKITDLNGMVTESYLTTNQYTTQGQINTQLVNYLKTTDLNNKVQQTVAYQNIKEITDLYTRVIGSTDAESRAKIAQITMTDSLFNTKVLEMVDIGGTNMLRDTLNFGPDWSHTAGTGGGASTRVVTNKTLPGGISGNSLALKFQNNTTSYIRLANSVTEPGKYTFSGYLDRIGYGNMSYTFYHGSSTRLGTVTTDTSKHAYFSFTFEKEAGRDDIYVKSTYNGTNEVYLTLPQLEKGNIATDWTPSPSDMATSQQVSSIEQKADSIQALVGTTKESVARAVMTSSLWETEVSKVIDSELEQEYKTVTSKVNIVDTGTAINSGEDYSGGKYHYFNYSEGVVQRTLNRNKTYTLAFSTQTSHNKGNLVSLEVKHYGTTEWVRIFSDNMTSGQQNTTLTFDNTVFASSLVDYRLIVQSVGDVKVPYIWGFKIYEEVDVEVPTTSSSTGAIGSKITQLYDMINLSVLGKEGALSRIAIGEEGIQLKSDLIHLDGKVKMTEAFAQKLFAEEVSADTVTAFSAKFANAIVGNLDVNNIGGNKASFIQLLLNGTNTALRATSSVVDIMRNDGSISTRLTQNGMEIWRDGSKVGDFESRSSISESGALANKKSISMTPERGSYISLGYYKSGETTSTRVLSVAGDTGRIYIGSALYPSESSTYGLQIQRFTLNSSGGIRVGSTGGSSGIFFGDFGHVSIQFNGIWYAMDRLIN